MVTFPEIILWCSKIETFGFEEDLLFIQTYKHRYTLNEDQTTCIFLLWFKNMLHQLCHLNPF